MTAFVRQPEVAPDAGKEFAVDAFCPLSVRGSLASSTVGCDRSVCWESSHRILQFAKRTDQSEVICIDSKS